MGTQVAPWLIFLLKIGLICNAILPYSEGLPQQSRLPEVLFPDSDAIRICRQQGRRDCPGGGNPQVLGPSFIRQSCSGTRATTQHQLQTAAEGCDLLQGNVLWPGDASRCAQVLSQGPCAQGHWVILSNDIGEESICAPRPCVGADKVLMNGQCYHVSDNSMCPPTMTLQTNEFGNGECECQLGMIYHDQSKRCYTPYSQGPCQQGFIIKAKDLGDRGITQCVRNPCPDQNMAPLDQQCHVAGGNSVPSQCHRINTAGPCSNGVLSIDGTSAEPGCSDRTIFGNLGVPCRRGSRRDRAGRCRKVFNGGKQINLRRPQNQNPRPRCRNDQLLLGGICITKG